MANDQDFGDDDPTEGDETLATGTKPDAGHSTFTGVPAPEDEPIWRGEKDGGYDEFEV